MNIDDYYTKHLPNIARLYLNNSAEEFNEHMFNSEIRIMNEYLITKHSDYLNQIKKINKNIKQISFKILFHSIANLFVFNSYIQFVDELKFELEKYKLEIKIIRININDDIEMIDRIIEVFHKKASNHITENILESLIVTKKTLKLLAKQFN